MQDSFGPLMVPERSAKERERKALLMFKQGIVADFGMLSTWRDDENGDCCKWERVHCSNKTGHVQIIHLRGLESEYNYHSWYSLYLIGTINITLLSELHELKHLDLSNNLFYTSEIPESIDYITNLRYLNLSHSQFGGSIPHQLGKLSHLQYLDLSWNELDGAIPPQLGILTKLQYLSLQENDLYGVIAPQLGNLSMLQSLRLDYNSNLTIGKQNSRDAMWLSKLSLLTNLGLSGMDVVDSHHLLRSVFLMPNLRELRLPRCGLALSALPSNFSTSLVILDLSGNKLKSAISDKWPFNFFPNLQELYLRGCDLSANKIYFLFSYFNFPSLVVLDLSFNNLTSLRTLNFSSNLQELDLMNNSLSSNISFLTSTNCNLSSLVKLDLSENELTSSSIFYWILNFTSNLHELDLYKNLLKGPIPYGFGNIMDSLQYLGISYNNLQGGVPISLGNICTLKSLSLSFNNLSGELSSFIHNSSWCDKHTLENLDLWENQITGVLPTNLSIFSSLQELVLSDNHLYGEIPESIGSLIELQSLFLNGNYLEGVITEFHFTNLFNLKDLSLSDNSLDLRISNDWVPPFHLQYLGITSCKLGSNFPNWLHSQNNLEELHISKVGISGIVPKWFWTILENIDIMDISYNNLAGEIPNLPLKLNYHPEISMTSNKFEGAIPSLLSQSSALHLSNNKFSDLGSLICGKLEDEVLGILDVSSNLLRGELPDYWNHLNSLTYVDLSNNNFSGEIPPSMGSLVNMQALILRNNSLIGQLPSFLENCSMLLLLDVSENQLLGPIPSWIGGSLVQLQVLSLQMNHLYGNLPLHICHLTQIRLLDLSQNNYSNKIPSCLKNFIVMAEENINPSEIGDHVYILSKYHVGYSFDFYVALMWKGANDLFMRPDIFLKSIDLSSNALTGEIPKEIMSLLGLVSLNLSRNNLSGKIPFEIGNFKSLEFLDLSRNELSGTIPSNLAHIDRLTTLDLSNNNLSGKIPTGIQLQSFNAFSYEGNLDPCGMPLDKKCPQNENLSPQVFDNEDDDSLFSQEFYLSLGLGFVVGFWGFLGPLLFCSSWRHANCRLVNRVANSIHVMVAIFVTRYLSSD